MNTNTGYLVSLLIRSRASTTSKGSSVPATTGEGGGNNGRPVSLELRGRQAGCPAPSNVAHQPSAMPGVRNSDAHIQHSSLDTIGTCSLDMHASTSPYNMPGQ